MRLPRLETERSMQFLRVREVNVRGQEKFEMTRERKWPLNCRRWRLGGQSIVAAESLWLVRVVVRGRRRVVSLERLLRAFLRLGKGIGSPTRERSRCLSLVHLERAGRLLILFYGVRILSEVGDDGVRGLL